MLEIFQALKFMAFCSILDFLLTNFMRSWQEWYDSLEAENLKDWERSEVKKLIARHDLDPEVSWDLEDLKEYLDEIEKPLADENEGKTNAN